MDNIIHTRESRIYLGYEGKGKNPFSDLNRGGSSGRQVGSGSNPRSDTKK